MLISSKITGNLVKQFLFLLYHQLAWAYDFVAWMVSLGEWKDWVYSVIPYLRGPTILEIGHGPGYLQAALLSRGFWICGLDESRWMSAIAAKRCNRLVNGLAQALPYRDGAFSQVVTTFPADFIFDPKTLSEIYRVIEPQGELVVMPVAWVTGRLFWERITAWLFRVTGQTPELDSARTFKYFAIPLENAHFHVDMIIKKAPSIELLIIIAKKSVSN